MNRHIPLDEPVDLLNVAFENPRKIKLQKEGIYGSSRRNKREKLLSKSEESHEAERIYSVPDRITGLLELEELRRTCPGRIWNFVRRFMLVTKICTHYNRLKSTSRTRYIIAKINLPPVELSDRNVSPCVQW